MRAAMGSRMLADFNEGSCTINLNEIEFSARNNRRNVRARDKSCYEILSSDVLWCFNMGESDRSIEQLKMRKERTEGIP